MDLDGFSATVENIYAAVTESTRWGAVLAEIRNLLGANTSGLVFAGSPRRHLQSLGNLESSAAQSYNAYYGRLDHVAAALEHSPAQLILSGRELIWPREQSEFHQDWIQANGLGDGLFVRLSLDTTTALLAFTTPRARYSFASTRRISLLRLLTPHLQQALATHQRMEAFECERLLHAESLDHSSQPTLIIDHESRIISHNDRAGELLEREDCALINQSGRLTASGTLAAPLRQAVDRATNSSEHAPATGSALVCHRARHRHRPPYLIDITPLRPRSLLTFADTALVTITDPSPPPRVPTGNQLIRLYGFTPSEARIMVAILQTDAPLPRIASDLGLKPTTARTHLQHIFQKVGVHRQADLIKVISSTYR